MQTAHASSAEEGSAWAMYPLGRVGTALMTVEPMSGDVDHSGGART